MAAAARRQCGGFRLTPKPNTTIPTHTSHVTNTHTPHTLPKHTHQAPVSGSKKPAIDGQLIILAAGDKSLFDDSAAAFGVMGKRSLHLGDVGAGARMKLVVNMIMGSMMGERGVVVV